MAATAIQLPLAQRMRAWERKPQTHIHNQQQTAAHITAMHPERALHSSPQLVYSTNTIFALRKIIAK